MRFSRLFAFWTAAALILGAGLALSPGYAQKAGGNKASAKVTDLKVVSRKWLSGLEELDAYAIDRTYTQYYKGDKYREDSSGGKLYTIYDCAKDRYYVINRDDQTYAVMTLKEALGKRKGLLYQFKVNGAAKVEAGGSKMSIAGKQAKNYILSMTTNLQSERSGVTVIQVKMEGEQWVTDVAQVSPKCQEILKAAYARGIFRFNKLLEPLYAEIGNLKGVPLNYDMILTLKAASGVQGVETGTIEAHSEVQSISTQTLPASLFEVPKGYRLVPVINSDDDY